MEKSNSDSKSKKLLLRLSGSRKVKSAPTSPNSSPQRVLIQQKSNLSLSVYCPRNIQECFWCRKKMLVDGDKMLAVKCSCCPPMYFCSKLCHRSHWIDPISGQCEMYTFIKDNVSDLDSPITWKEEEEYVHDIKEVKNTLYFPVNITTVIKYLTDLQAFKLDLNMNDLLVSVSNLNITSNYTLAVIPKSRYMFEFLFIDKIDFNFSEYNKFLQMCKPYFRSQNIPQMLTQRLINLQN